VICNLPPDAREGLFRLTRLDIGFCIRDTLHEGLEAFRQRAVEVSCPIHGCGQWIRIAANTVNGRVSWPDRWTGSCLSCGGSVTISTRSPSTSPLPTLAVLIEVAIPTYENERVHVVREKVIQFGKSQITGRSLLSLTGRLDLFASESLERGWETVPPPRRIVVDLSHTTEVSAPGVEALLDLCARQEDDAKTSILINTERSDQRTAFSGCPLAFVTAEDAAKALDPIPSKAKLPLRVNVRHG
jgi:hypothetical protein